MGNQAPLIDSIAINPSPAAPQAQATLGCAAHDPDGQITGISLQVSAGALPNGTLSQAASITQASSAVGTLTWSTPGPGTYSVTCTARDNGGWFGGSAVATQTVSVTVSAPASLPPEITAVTASAHAVLVGGAVELSATATDPENDPLTWSWSANGGTLQQNGAHATWIAPGVGGEYAVRVLATDPSGQQAERVVTLRAELQLGQGALGVSLRAPRRIASSARGPLYAVDAADGQLWILTRKGEAMAAPQLSEKVTAVTVCGGATVVATATGKLLRLDPEQGRLQGTIPLAGGRLAGASGLACDEETGTIFAAERERAQVRAIRPDGTTAFTLTHAGTAPLDLAADVAVDDAGGLLWVLQATNEEGSLAHAFTLQGAYVRSVAPFGSATGEVSRGGGLAVTASGQVYISDTFQGTVKAFDRTGGWLGEVGTFGSAAGQLRQPNGLAWLTNGDLVISNLDAGRIERFGSGVPLPSCTGDLDCDGLTDIWETAHGLNPHDPRDAVGDRDADGLSNLDEQRLGTDPNSADSDGDGYSDDDEVRTGYDPLDPFDHKPVLVAGAPVVSDPGLVKLYATLQARSACAVRWSQTAGPAVILRDASSVTPSFIGRAAATYRFTGVATCGQSSSDPVEVVATVRDLPPRPAPWAVATVMSGQDFTLDGRFSSDANGQPLQLEWDQLLGPPLLATTAEPTADARAAQPGLLQFLLTATDSGAHSAQEEVSVLVLAPGQQAPTALAQSPVIATVGDTVRLDASDSVGPPGRALTFGWTQTGGPVVALSSPTSATPSFVPSSAGRYVFEVTVGAGALRAPADKVFVYVSEAGLSLPVAVAPSHLSGPVGEPLPLDGARSTAAGTTHRLVHHWRQVSGPAAGLTDADRAVATVVPFSPGTFLFELVVTEGAAQSTPVLVRVDADEPGSVRPVASATGPAVATTDGRVTLDGRESTAGNGLPLQYRWRQLSGPWVPLDDATAEQPSFTPRAPGLYGFELVVDDGAVQSAPAQVGVMVFPRNGGRP